MPTVSQLLTRFLVDLASRAGFVWEKVTARYRDKATGRFVSESALRELSDGFVDNVRNNLQGIGQQLAGRSIDLATFQRRFAQELKDSYLTNYMISRGGKNALTQADYGRIGGYLKNEYRFLNQFGRDIASGTMSEAQILARIDLYAENTKRAYEAGQIVATIEADDGFLVWRFGATEQHCADCFRLNGQVHKASKWESAGIAPKSPDLACGGYHCDCRLEPHEGPEKGNF